MSLLPKGRRPSVVAALTFGSLLALGLTLTTCLADNEKGAFIDPESAGPDAVIMGEYEGTRTAKEGGEEAKFGVQVIALGGGKFQAMGYQGGLPGAGWDQGERNEAKGQRVGDSTAANFESPIGTAKILEGAEELQGFDLEGRQIATAKKVKRQSPTYGAVPPEGAVLLFHHEDAESLVKNWEGGRVWEGMFLRVGTRTKQKFRDFTLHMEFYLPFMPDARGQGRANSGVYLQNRYECQILDSFGLTGENNECGGFYKIAKPKVNMCFPPLSWQTYDIDFTAAKYDDSGKKTDDAVVTVRQNGVVIHDKLVLPNATAGGSGEGPQPGPIFLQDHGNPVLFDNIWVLEKKTE